MKTGMRREATGNSKTLQILGLVLCALTFVFHGSVAAQQSGSIPRIGLLSATSESNLAARIKALRQGLRELGYIEGQNIIIEARYADGKLNRQREFAAELAKLSVDIIVTGGPTGTRAAKQATEKIPIVMAQDNDPVGSGFVKSLARPGANVTGLSMLSPEISGKTLEILKESIPRLARVGIVGNSKEPGTKQSLEETQAAASVAGIQVPYFELQARQEIETIFASIKQHKLGALILLRNPILGANRKRVMDLMSESRLPGMFPNRNWVKAGGLMYYGASITDIWRRAATYIDKILRGAKPANLPVEQPTKFEFIVNLKTAKQLGLTIPPNVLARADEMVR